MKTQKTSKASMTASTTGFLVACTINSLVHYGWGFAAILGVCVVLGFGIGIVSELRK